MRKRDVNICVCARVHNIMKSEHTHYNRKWAWHTSLHVYMCERNKFAKGFCINHEWVRAGVPASTPPLRLVWWTFKESCSGHVRFIPTLERVQGVFFFSVLALYFSFNSSLCQYQKCQVWILPDFIKELKKNIWKEKPKKLNLSLCIFKSIKIKMDGGKKVLDPTGQY